MRPMLLRKHLQTLMLLLFWLMLLMLTVHLLSTHQGAEAVV